jgi:signal transduction histidine kinase
MAAHITHEIRNPLASLGLNVELLADEVGEGNEEARNLLTSMSKEVDRLSDITETYLRFVRLPKPKLEHEDLAAIATSVMKFSGSELALAKITWSIDVAPDLPEVMADESQLRQALLNLVRNAKEAMSGGGNIHLELTASAVSEGQVRMVLADSGPGIARENIANVFEPFFSTKAKGTGLGLALVQQIVNEHGGKIEVDCPPEGGTRFSITLPAAKPNAPEVAG